MTRSAKPQCSTCKHWTRLAYVGILGDCRVLEKPSPETAHCEFHEEPAEPEPVETETEAKEPT